MLTPISEMTGSEEKGTEELGVLAIAAWDYVTRFSWCRPITETFLAERLGSRAALFLFEFDGAIGDGDDRLWIVAGDLPGAYMAVGPRTPRHALEAYCQLLEDWVRDAFAPGARDNTFPFDIEPTREHARAVREKIALLRREVIPHASTDSIDVPRFPDELHARRLSGSQKRASRKSFWHR